MDTLTKLVAQIQPGYIYLTLGTTYQLSSICHSLNLSPHLLFEPKRKELIETLYYHNYSYNCFIIILKELKSSTKSVATNEYILPSDLEPFEDNYVFIPLVGLDCEVTAAAKKAAQSLEGGKYRILDLRNTSLKFLPFDNNQEPIYTTEQTIVYSLLSAKHIMRWATFTQNELRQWFVTPGQVEPILLIRSKATSLIPFILPFCKSIEHYWHKNPSGILLKFAIWVFLSTTVWNTNRCKGLTVSKNKKGETVFYYNPSVKARMEWNNFTHLVTQTTKLL
jgi:hypothetical protein